MTVIRNEPDAEYRAVKALSQSVAKVLLDSPEQAKHDMENPSKPTPAMNLGILVHALALGQEHPFVEKTWDARTKAGKESDAAVEAAGKTPMSAEEWDKAHAMAAKVSAEFPLNYGSAEVSLYGDINGTAIKGRVDYLTDSAIVDLKTTATPLWKFDGEIYARRYHLQAAWYLTLAELNGLDADRFVLVAVGKTAPYLTRAWTLRESAIAVGRDLMREALKIYDRCVMFSEWPATNDADATIGLPSWATERVFQ